MAAGGGASNLLISVREFKRRVSEGQKLLILDDMVIDYDPYDHPGG